MAAGGKRNENDYIDLLKKIGENDCGENQLRRWDQEGKLYVGGTQYISPQGIQYVRECLQNQGSPLVTAGKYDSGLESNRNILLHVQITINI